MNLPVPPKTRLGRGLDVLLPSAIPPAAPSGSLFVAIEDLHPNRSQPRTHFDAKALEELASSIREVGVLEPILVRRRSVGGFEIIAGERRWRAAQKAGLKQLPVFVRELSDRSAFEAAIVENLQREDLNPVETARALQRLASDYGHSQESIATLLGKDRSTVANSLRLLKLPASVLAMVESNELSEGHARALLGAPDPASTERLARAAIAHAWSVRETERKVRATTSETDKEKSAAKEKSVNVRDLERRLTGALGTRVNVDDKKGAGHLAIYYSNYEELDRLLEKLLG